ncbi:MAG: NAD(P)/FAD-dependent oxidoreductase [Sandaracinaceae bacterium]|nr:NAD(P)/FAD-dependent oxidoreductase [Sandaracinaceae bacterium]
MGSGPGGLAAAVLLAEHGDLRVLVLERHYVAGGLTQTFRRRRHEFEVGVHYVGQVGRPGMALRRIFDGLTDGQLAWSSLGAVHDRVSFDGHEVCFGDDPSRTREALVRFAPTEAAAIDGYLDAVRACVREAPPFLLARAEPRPIDDSRVPFRRFTDPTTTEMLDRLGASPRLAALLAYCSGNYACPPDRSSFAAHAIAAGTYLEGAAYPVGGGSRVAATMARALADRGGAIVIRAGVDAIRVRDGQAVGVRLEDGRELDARLVVSDAGLAATSNLLDAEAPGVGAMREAARTIRPSLAHCALYLGLDRDHAALGLGAANRWDLRVAPADAEAAMAAWLRGDVDRPPYAFVSSPGACDPTWSTRQPDRASVVALFNAPFEPFAAWADGARGRRGPAYEALKARLQAQALAAVLDVAPELEPAIDHVELSTPVSTKTFAGHAHGEVAGLDHTPDRFRYACTPRTAIRGLALAGQDAWLAGVGGAVLGGVAAASYLLRRNLARELLLGRPR